MTLEQAIQGISEHIHMDMFAHVWSDSQGLELEITSRERTYQPTDDYIGYIALGNDYWYETDCITDDITELLTELIEMSVD